MKHLILSVLVSGAVLISGIHAQQQQTAAPQKRPTIRQRQVNQQKRIGQGVESGQLTPRETVRLEKKEAALNREVRRDRKDGGGLTVKERRKIDRQQDRLSKEIYKQKHDRQRVPPK